MTVQQLTAALLEGGIENAREEALLLAAHVCAMDINALRLSRATELPDPDGALARALQARLSHVPLQYLIGRWPFWRQEYEVSPDCLIPRSDTEILVEAAVRRLPRGARVLDLGTGSGCIAISLLCERPDLTGVAVDRFAPTLALAKRNATRNGVGEDRLVFIEGDILTGDFLHELGSFDAILSNPPYITAAAMKTLAPELSHEPPAALYGGEDGLDFYRRIVSGADYRAACKADGMMLFEIGYDQADALRAIAAAMGDDCTVLRDLGGCDRVAILTHGIN